MKKIIWIIGILIIILGIVLFINNDKQTSFQNTEKIKIGVILPQTGGSGTSGEKIFEGIRLAESQLPKGEVEVIYEDYNSDVVTAVTVAQKLVNTDKVDILIGPYGSAEVLAIAPILKDKNIGIFSFSLCVDEFKELDNVFCGYPSASQQLDTVIPKIKSSGIKTLALVNQNSVFGLASRDSMKEKANIGGYKVIADELVQGNEKDHRTIIAKILKEKPDAIFTAQDNPADALNFMKQLNDLRYEGMRITFIDVDNKYLKQFGKAVDGTYAPGIAPSNFSKSFTDAYQKKYNKEPDYLSASGYDTFRFVYGYMKSNTKRKSLDTISSYSYKKPAIKDFKYLSNRTVEFAMELWTAKNMEYVRAE